MPRKKKQETKPQDIPTKVDTQKDIKPFPVQWYQMEQYVGQPIWDSREKKWRILDGYKRKRKYIFSYIHRYCGLAEL